MLPKQHRLTASRDFQAVMRHGARAGTSTVVVTVLQRNENGAEWRAGFIVSKAVGNAVVRHRTQRRLRHIMRDLMDSEIGSEAAQDAGDLQLAGLDVVVRALPPAAHAGHQELSADVYSGWRRAMKKLRKMAGSDQQQRIRR